MKRCLLSLLTLCLGLSAFAAADMNLNGESPLGWSRRLARDEMARTGNSLEFGATPKSRWDYTASLFALSVWTLGQQTGDKVMTDYASRAVGSFVQADGSIAGYKLDEYNIDQVNPGKMLLRLCTPGADPRYATAARLLRDQMRTHPRTSEGGFWHKKRYPDQMWLDGLYMATPFLAEYGQRFGEPELFNEACHQIILIDRHLYNPATGLYLHAWDEKHAQAWADKTTGLSPNPWSRSIGWYAMAIVDTLDYIPATHEEIDNVVRILRKVADGIARYQDPESGLWWQVTDQGPRKGNYLEASGSAMFVYALAKGINHGYLPRDVFEPVVLKGYRGIATRLLKVSDNGKVSLSQVCNVAGLGYTNAAGRPRDGSFDYYISEPIIDNDHKGVGPLILAGIEVEALLKLPVGKSASTQPGWAQHDEILARIKAPEFPARDFPITDFGAKSDNSNSGAAIQAAIEACHKAGGGRVVVPSGTWLTAPLRLLSNVNLVVSEGATLRFAFDPDTHPVVFTRWEGVECMNYAPLFYAWERSNIAITGKGTLDGGASYETWWAWNNKKERPTRQTAARNRLIDMGEKGVPVEQRVFGKDCFLRPNFIQPYRCENVLIEGVRIINSPMWELNPVLCRNVIVRGLDINSHGPNNDGCDPESCTDVLIEHTTFDTGDDCIAIKSGRNNDGRRVNVPSQNLIVRNCLMKDGHGGVVLGSEISGGCRNVYVEDCVMDSPNLDRALRLKSNAVRGGFLENVYMRRVKIGKVAEAVLTVDLLYEEGAVGAFPPVVRNINIEHTSASGAPRVLFVRGFPGATIDGIRFSDCSFLGLTEAEVLEGAGQVSFRNVKLVPAKMTRSTNSPTKDKAGN